MVDNKQKFTLEIKQQKVALGKSLVQLRKRYKLVKKVFLFLLAIIPLYMIITIIFIILYSDIEFYSFALYQIFSLILLIIILLRLRKEIKLYNICYLRGFSLWCKLADIADWSILRREFYFKSEKLSPIINAISDFYEEINKYLSPQRPHTKYIYYLIVILLLTYLLTIIYSFYWINIHSELNIL